MAIPRAELRVGGEKVEAWVVDVETEVVVEAFERAEWARKAAKKLAKKGRLVGMVVVEEAVMVVVGRRKKWCFARGC